MEKHQDFNPSPKLHDKEEKKEEKPRKLFNPPKGTGEINSFDFFLIFLNKTKGT